MMNDEALDFLMTNTERDRLERWASNGSLRVIGGLRTRRLYQFTGNLGDGAVDEGVDASITAGANVVSSERVDSKYHAVLLDLDVPAYLVPSTTPGHSHLYIDVAVPKSDYFSLLER